MNSLILANNFAIFHNEARVPEDFDVFKRVPGHGDDVGVEVRFELADLAFPVEEFCAVDETGPKGLGGRHAVLHHEFVLAGLGAVGEGPDVGAHGEGDSRSHLLLELAGVEGLLFFFAFCCGG